MKISQNLRIFSKFMEFSVFRAIHPPETLIFLRDYWCFRHPAIFTKFWVFNKKSKICEKIQNSTFSHFSAQIHILRKMGPGAPKKTNNGWNCIGFKGPGASGPRGTKNAKSCANRAKYFAFSLNILILCKIKQFAENHHFALCRNVGIPCKFQPNKPGTPRINVVPPPFLRN